MAETVVLYGHFEDSEKPLKALISWPIQKHNQTLLYKTVL